MTLTSPRTNALHKLFETSTRQGLIPSGETLPDIPSVADVRRLRRVLPGVWGKIAEGDKRELYQVCQQMLTSKVPPLKLVSTLPQTLRAVTHLVRTEGRQGLVRYGRDVGIELQALQQEVVSLWEDDHPMFTRRLEDVVAEAKVDRGTRVQSRDDLKAVLDDLF